MLFKYVRTLALSINCLLFCLQLVACFIFYFNHHFSNLLCSLLNFCWTRRCFQIFVSKMSFFNWGRRETWLLLVSKSRCYLGSVKTGFASLKINLWGTEAYIYLLTNRITRASYFIHYTDYISCTKQHRGEYEKEN